MMLRIFAVKDTKAQSFDSPFVARTPGEAERGFANIVNKSDTKYGLNPEDFHLFELGEYDPETAQITPLDAPQSVASAIALVSRAKSVDTARH